MPLRCVAFRHTHQHFSVDCSSNGTVDSTGAMMPCRPQWQYSGKFGMMPCGAIVKSMRGLKGMPCGPAVESMRGRKHHCILTWLRTPASPLCTAHGTTGTDGPRRP
eukprot:4987110-Prymnesium_polylepis.1